MKRSKPWIEQPDKDRPSKDLLIANCDCHPCVQSQVEEGNMTFPSLDRAFDYLSGQNPGKMMIVLPWRREGGAVAYHVQFHIGEVVLNEIVPWSETRMVHLNLLANGEWGISIT